MFFVIILGTKSTPPTKMTSLTTQVSHSSVEEQSNRQSGQVMGSIPHWDSENFIFLSRPTTRFIFLFKVKTE